jgi:hypothetical protein
VKDALDKWEGDDDLDSERARLIGQNAPVRGRMTRGRLREREGNVKDALRLPVKAAQGGRPPQLDQEALKVMKFSAYEYVLNHSRPTENLRMQFYKAVGAKLNRKIELDIELWIRVKNRKDIDADVTKAFKEMYWFTRAIYLNEAETREQISERIFDLAYGGFTSLKLEYRHGQIVLTDWDKFKKKLLKMQARVTNLRARLQEEGYYTADFDVRVDEAVGFSNALSQIETRIAVESLSRMGYTDWYRKAIRHVWCYYIRRADDANVAPRFFSGFKSWAGTLRRALESNTIQVTFPGGIECDFTVLDYVAVYAYADAIKDIVTSVSTERVFKVVTDERANLGVTFNFAPDADPVVVDADIVQKLIQKLP